MLIRYKFLDLLLLLMIERKCFSIFFFTKVESLHWLEIWLQILFSKFYPKVWMIPMISGYLLFDGIGVNYSIYILQQLQLLVKTFSFISCNDLQEIQMKKYILWKMVISPIQTLRLRCMVHLADESSKKPVSVRKPADKPR